MLNGRCGPLSELRHRDDTCGRSRSSPVELHSFGSFDVSGGFVISWFTPGGDRSSEPDTSFEVGRTGRSESALR